MVAIATYAFLLSWNEYLYAVLFLSGETHITIPVAMGNFLATDDAPWNILMTVAVLYSIPPGDLLLLFPSPLGQGPGDGSRDRRVGRPRPNRSIRQPTQEAPTHEQAL